MFIYSMLNITAAATHLLTTFSTQKIFYQQTHYFHSLRTSILTAAASKLLFKSLYLLSSYARKAHLSSENNVVNV